jgi:putative heme-binding domain-containing protein
MNSSSVRVRASNLDALIAAGDAQVDLLGIARNDKELALRAMAVRELVQRKADVSEFLDSKVPAAIRAEALAGIELKSLPQLLEMLGDSDPFLRHAAIHKLGSLPEWLIRIDRAKFKELKDPKQRIGVLLAWRTSTVENYPVIEQCLADTDPDVRLIAAKWIADEKLSEARAYVEKALTKSNLDPREFIALTTTMARLDDKPVNEDALAGYFLQRVDDTKAPAAMRLLALRGIPSGYAKLKTESLVDLLKDDDENIRVEVLRVLTERADAKAANVVRSLAVDSKQGVAIRAQAIVAWAASTTPDANQLLDVSRANNVALQMEALRAITQSKVNDDQKARLVKLGVRSPAFSDLVSRVLGTPNIAQRPKATDTDVWLKRLEGPADPEAGRRIFENGRVATCAKCHRVDGRGANIGPDLSLVGRNDKKWIVESILQPSAVVAPHYQAWRIDTVDSRVLTGLLVHTHLDESYYVDAKGTRFKVEAKDVAEVSAAKESIMPNGLVDTLTDQEIRDLVAYLAGRK